MAGTNKVDIVGMRRKISEWQAEAAKQPDKVTPPTRIVEPVHARAIVDRVRIVQSVLTDYLRVLDGSKALAPFPVHTFDRHRALLMVLKHSSERLYAIYATLLDRSIDLISDEEETYERVLTQLYANLQLAQQALETAKRGDTFSGSAEELDDIIAGYQRQITKVGEGTDGQ